MVAISTRRSMTRREGSWKKIRSANELEYVTKQCFKLLVLELQYIVQHYLASKAAVVFVHTLVVLAHPIIMLLIPSLSLRS